MEYSNYRKLKLLWKIAIDRFDTQQTYTLIQFTLINVPYYILKDFRLMYKIVLRHETSPYPVLLSDTAGRAQVHQGKQEQRQVTDKRR